MHFIYYPNIVLISDLIINIVGSTDVLIVLGMLVLLECWTTSVHDPSPNEKRCMRLIGLNTVIFNAILVISDSDILLTSSQM